MRFYGLSLRRMKGLPLHSLLLQAEPVRFQLGHYWCACLLLLFIHSLIWGVGAASEPTGYALCKQKQPLQPLCPTLTAMPGIRRERHADPCPALLEEGYFKGLEARVKLELVCSLGRLGLQQVFDSVRAFLSSSLSACQPFTIAQDNEEGQDILTSLQDPSLGPPGQHRA